VYTGTVGRVNGLDYLVRLASSMRRLAPEIRFLIVGDGVERANVARLAAHLNVLNRSLFMMDPVPKREIPAVLAGSDLATSLVIDMPGFAADSANKVFDALAAGRPVAVNYGGWLSDLLVDHGAGMILDHHDVDHAAQQVLDLLSSPGATAEAGRAARRLAEQRFSRDDLARELEAALLLAVGRASEAEGPEMRRAPSTR
jgi:glycosyltransferase involved in cell wall biosynthesis